MRKLRLVGDVLILAAAAIAKITALRLDALRRGLHHAHQPRAGKILFDLGDFRFDDFAHEHERDEHNEVVQPRDALAAERDVRDGQ